VRARRTPPEIAAAISATAAGAARAAPLWLLLLICVPLSFSCLAIPALSQPKEARESTSSFSVWPEAGFDRAYTRMVQPEEIYGKQVPDRAYRLAFTLVFLEGTNWNASRVLKHARKTARILDQCDIRLGAVRLVKARVPPELRSIDVTDMLPGSDVPRNVYRLAACLPKSTQWPVLFFVGNIHGEEVLARSYQQGDVAAAELKDYPYMNTAWISYRAHWVERPEDEYSALAHEVAHLLCQCGHERGSQRHLLHEFRNFLGARVLPQHCEKFNGSSLIQPQPVRGSE
jgi:hypothetical protein